MTDRMDRALERLRESGLLAEHLEALAAEAELRIRQCYTGQGAFVIAWLGGVPRRTEIVEALPEKHWTFVRRSA